jgi:3-hydroxybutyryl-CoA dehydrogenase
VTHGGAGMMEINKVCVVGPEGVGTIVEQKCKQAGIEVSRVSIEGDLKDLRGTDLVIDQFYGDLDVKRRIVKIIEAVIPEKAIFASAPLFVSLTQIASLFKKRDKVIGLLSPFYSGISNFAEIVVGVETSEETSQGLERFLGKIGFSCIKSRDSAGFVLNRVLVSMINEAIYVYSSGLAPIESIDQMMKLAANFPLGPLEYADEIGLDNILNLLTLLMKELGSQYRPCPLLTRKVEAGHLGKKSGRGFYEYKT